VFHTGHQNFLRINKADGVYEVYFTVRRSKDVNFDLEIYVQSAYKRTKGKSPNAGKIRFYMVAYNTLHN
jgi:glycerol-3-phosphate cytidylyltransferase-like family protein